MGDAAVDTAESTWPNYRGRVRTGCLTCRRRKVKCDELRPTCRNCSKKGRECVFKHRKAQSGPAMRSDVHGHSTPTQASVETSIQETPDPTTISAEYLTPPFEQSGDQLHVTPSRWETQQDLPSNLVVAVASRLGIIQWDHHEPHAIPDSSEQPLSPSTFISRDINLTTTMDKLTACESPEQSWIPFFVDVVDCPWITPYDGINWRRAKTSMVEVGKAVSVVSSAITAVSALYKAQLHGLPLSTALTLYAVAKRAFDDLLTFGSEGFDAILMAAFLLTLFAFIHYESMPILREPSAVFMERLETWIDQGQAILPLSARIVAWLRLLDASAVRGGGVGILSSNLHDRLASTTFSLPNLRPTMMEQPEPHVQLFESLSAPIFNFYMQLQTISRKLAMLTHYHRSRNTTSDQEEVVGLIVQIKGRLRELWNDRPATLRQDPQDLSSLFAPQIASPIITLAGVCTAAYYAEFVEIDRIMGDPVSRDEGSKQAMSVIQAVVDGEWNAFQYNKLNPAYLRPLFLYAIECMDAEKNQWAVHKLKEIKDNVCRSDFFASFGRALSDVQLRKERRVTSKYFCISYFGVPPPYL